MRGHHAVAWALRCSEGPQQTRRLMRAPRAGAAAWTQRERPLALLHRTEIALVFVELAWRSYRRTWLWSDLDTQLHRHARRVYGKTPNALVCMILRAITAAAAKLNRVNDLDAWAASLLTCRMRRTWAAPRAPGGARAPRAPRAPRRTAPAPPLLPPHRASACLRPAPQFPGFPSRLVEHRTSSTLAAWFDSYACLFAHLRGPVLGNRTVFLRPTGGAPLAAPACPPRAGAGPIRPPA
ncbi:MAG: hypothetical protein J3K34DRAFT_236175 [Monoraphidium minutum]|nr:MAG: hypothetical protein J3K34DRAFT_236175 [Monoraphidium minutum]